ncbi:hypothetical protein SAMN05421812_104235 [Asanoa hainanensis]|uniref:Uncharacterized protein n=1 Tax=Asanoa hainanensis TaxID=560556 RepID=A0A239LFM2_9ACTN|nr:hypothetical protein [Asanoa hainanensis]SNT28439.1 hypothetical protein SAMN05421812_104235 [Asanoa hainanensis]
MSKKNRAIEISFVVIAIVAVWNLQLNNLAIDIAAALGFREDSFGQEVVVGIFVPAVVGGIAVVAQWFYRNFGWRITAKSNNCRGSWVYVLLAQAGDEEFPIAGWFKLSQDAAEMKIDDARAYYIEPDDLLFRGDWTSDTVWLRGKELGIVFAMRAEGVGKEPIPSQYSGFIQLRPRIADRRATPIWTGHFHDLGDRTGVHGPIAAKRLRKAPRGDLEGVLEEHVDELRTVALRIMGRAGTRQAPAAVPPGPRPPEVAES